MKKALIILGTAAFIIGGCNGEAGDEQDPVGGDNGNGADNGAEEEDNGETVDAGEGMELYEANCLECHGEDMEGASGPALDGYSEDEVLTAIEEGPGSMPEDLVTGEEADAVAEYVDEEAG